MDRSPRDPSTPTVERETPRHGYQGDRFTPPSPGIPAGLVVALSREAGARGSTIARRVARKLGWQIYDQELLEYLAQETLVHQGLLDTLSPAAAAWVEERLQQLLREQQVSQHPSIISLVRVILSLGAQGRAVLIGRGAGCILPRATTLHVRLVAPLAERIAYMAQWLRLSDGEAAEKVRQRDERRADFLMTHFHRDPGEVQHYDMVLNSGLLGEDLCAELITRAAQGRGSRVAGSPSGGTEDDLPPLRG
jgi:cytidylate kinase